MFAGNSTLAATLVDPPEGVSTPIELTSFEYDEEPCIAFQIPEPISDDSYVELSAV